jgi:hypothetical protein
MPVKNQRFRVPTRPGCVKYSALAGNAIRRGTISGSTNESRTARWLDATSAPPWRGRLSAPSTRGRNATRISGPSRTYFMIQ